MGNTALDLLIKQEKSLVKLLQEVQNSIKILSLPVIPSPPSEGRLDINGELCYTITSIGEEHCLSGVQLNNILVEKGVINRHPSTSKITLNPAYVFEGLTSLGRTTKGVEFLVWTPKGKEFIANILN